MRDFLKSIARIAATIAVAPALVSYWLRSRAIGKDRALEGSSQAIALLPGVTGVYLRGAFLNCVLARFHPTASVHFGTLLSQTGARIDEHVYVGPGCHLGLVHLERDVLIGSGVQIPSGAKTHGTARLDVPIREQPGQPVTVRVGEGSWVGSGAIIMADVGRHCVVAAGSVVTRAIPDYSVAAGVPARVFRDRRNASDN